MTFKNYKSLKIGDWNFKKLIRASDGLILFNKNDRKTSKAYIQDGLICMYDAIDNIDFGVHNQMSKTWTDLISGTQATFSQAYFTPNSFFVTQQNGLQIKLPVNSLVSDAVNRGEITIECSGINDHSKYTNQGLVNSAGNITIGIYQNGYGTDGTSSRYYGSNIQCYNIGNWFLTPNNYATQNADGTWTVKDIRLTYSLAVGNGKIQPYRDGLSQLYDRAFTLPASLNAKYFLYTMALNGCLNYLRIYNRKLTSDEIAYNRKIDEERFFTERIDLPYNYSTDGLISYWDDTNGQLVFSNTILSEPNQLEKPYTLEYVVSVKDSNNEWKTIPWNTGSYPLLLRANGTWPSNAVNAGSDMYEGGSYDQSTRVVKNQTTYHRHICFGDGSSDFFRYYDNIVNSGTKSTQKTLATTQIKLRSFANTFNETYTLGEHLYCLRVYNRPLTSSEYQAHLNIDKQRFNI